MWCASCLATYSTLSVLLVPRAVDLLALSKLTQLSSLLRRSLACSALHRVLDCVEVDFSIPIMPLCQPPICCGPTWCTFSHPWDVCVKSEKMQPAGRVFLSFFVCCCTDDDSAHHGQSQEARARRSPSSELRGFELIPVHTPSKTPPAAEPRLHRPKALPLL